MATWRTAIAAVVLLIAGSVFLALSVRNELRARALDDHGEIALAEVTEIALDHDTDDGERVAYRLTVGDASYEGANRHVSRPQLDVARGIHRIEVRYLPEDPSVNAPTQAATRRTQFMAFFVSCAVLFAGLALVGFHVSTKRKTGRWMW